MPTDVIPISGSQAPDQVTTPGPGSAAPDYALHRAATAPDYFAWLDHIRPAAGCAHPIRLSGEIVTVERATGRLLASVSTQDMPDGQIYKPCGNRRAAVCPSCARTYQGDAFQLIRTGLTGGKGIPATVGAHPAVFVTLTAPSFGPVHTHRTSTSGLKLACRPRRYAVRCPHGVDLRCHRFHIVIRLDGHHPDQPDTVLPPPARLDVEHLQRAVTAAARSTAFTTVAHPVQPAGWRIGWGEQIDIRPIRLSGHGEMSDGMAAGYLAKYATKSTEATGHTSRRLTAEIIDLYADPNGTHAERLIDACWTLGTHRDWQALRRWAHMLGFGGHFLTKARHYSITFQILRDRRVIWRRTENGDPAADHDEDTILIVSTLAYVGAGWPTPGDALLANTAAALARDRQQVAREEVTATA